MFPTRDPPHSEPSTALAHLLCAYLATAVWPECPGCDGMVEADVIPDYLNAARVGTVPGEAELCSRHPELTSEIIALFYLLAVAPTLQAGTAAEAGPGEVSGTRTQTWP